MTKPTLTVWCLSDGRPGHFNQSKGLLQSLALGYRLDIHWVDCTLRVKPLRPLLRTLFNSGMAQHWQHKLHRFERPDTPPELIISTGGNTAYLNIALAQQYGCPNLFIGSLRGLQPQLFSAVLTIEAIDSDNNVVMPLAPVPSDRAAQQQAASTLREQLPATDTRPLWALLIGGATDDYPYQPADWQALAAQMTELARNQGIRWLVTSSRRTGVDVEQQLAAQLPEDVIAQATWFCQQPRKVMAGYLGAAEVIFCSEDSLSMLTEAVASGKPTIAFAPATHSAADNRYQAALQRLCTRGWLQRQPMARLSAPQPQTTHIPDPTTDLWQRLHQHRRTDGAAILPTGRVTHEIETP